MFKNLEKLRHCGYKPDAILDIGAYKGLWTYECKNIFPEASYYLFEAIAYEELDVLKDRVPDVAVFQALLDETEREVDWYEGRNTGDSMFRENTRHYKDCAPVKKNTVRLETLVEPYLPQMNNVMIKVDCQGAEIPILKGAGKILEKTDFIILEMPFFGEYNRGVPTFLEHIQYMDTIGYIPFDILEKHYLNGYTIQVDILFVSKKHNLNRSVQEAILQ